MPTEGKVQRNPSTGQYRVYKNGQWVMLSENDVRLDENGKVTQYRIPKNAAPQPAAPKPEPEPGPQAGPMWNPYLSRVKAARDEKIANLEPIPVRAVPEEQFSEMPEMNNAISGSFVGDMGIGLAQTFLYPEAVAQIVANKVDHVKVYQHPSGEYFADIGGRGNPDDFRRFNAEGISRNDLLQVTGDAVGIAAGGAGAAKVIGKETAKRIAPRVATQVAAAAGFSAGKDFAGDVASDAPLDLNVGRTATEAAMAGGTQGLLNMGGRYLGAPIKEGMERLNIRRQIAGAGDSLLPKVEKGLKAAGYNLDGLNAAERSALNNLSLEYPNLDGEQLGRAVYGHFVTGSKPTSAFVTQDGGLATAEDLFRGRGGRTGARMTRQSLDNPRNYVEGQVESVGARGEDLGTVADELIDQRQTDYAQYTGRRLEPGGEPQGGLFKETREELRQSILSNEQNSRIRQRIYDKVRVAEDYDIARSMTGNPVDAEFGPTRRGGSALSLPAEGDKGLTPADWLNWAERTSNSGDPGSAAAARAVREVLTEDAVEDLIYGNSDNVLKYMEILENYRDMKSGWTRNSLIERISRPDVDPTRVAEIIMGSRNSNTLLRKAGSRQAVRELKDRLSPDNWLKVRNELVYRLTSGDTVRRSGDNIPGAQMRENFLRAVENDRDFLIDVLDDGTGNGKEVLAQWDRFTKYAADAQIGTTPAGKSKLGSKTTFGMMSSGLMDRFGKMPLIGPVAQGGAMIAKAADDRATQIPRLLDPNLLAREGIENPYGLGALLSGSLNTD